MRVSKLFEENRFKVRNAEGQIEFHRIDQGGNYFINGKCVNPSRSDLVLYTDNVWRHPEITDVHYQNMEGKTVEPIVLNKA